MIIVVLVITLAVGQTPLCKKVAESCTVARINHCKRSHDFASGVFHITKSVRQFSSYLVRACSTSVVVVSARLLQHSLVPERLLSIESDQVRCGYMSGGK
jgi:hypothetical protein